MKALILKKNLLNPDFLKIRYGGLNVLEKKTKIIKDNKKYGVPVQSN